MKFGKSYMETLASPNFPQEWREGAIEYKHLKKLINGVVAELESLGLGAEVLRDLMLPPEEGGDSDSERSSGKEASSSKLPGAADAGTTKARSRDRSGSSADDSSADEAPNSEGRAARRRINSVDADALSPFGSSAPLPTLTEEEEAKRVSADGEPVKRGRSEIKSPAVSYVQSLRNESADSDSDDHARASNLSNASAATAKSDAQHHHNTLHGNQIATPAALWVSNIAHTSERRRSSRKSGGSGNVMTRSDSLGSSGTGSRDASVDAGPSRLRGDTAALDSDDAEAANIEVLVPKFPPREQSDVSADEAEGTAGLQPFRGIGKKDLEAMRRASASDSGPSSDDRSAPMARSSSATHAAQPSDDDGRHDWGGHAWRERGGNAWKEGDPKSRSASAGPSRPNPMAEWKLPQTARRGRWVKGKGGRRARAEYELGGTKEHPIPRIRLFVESPINSGDEAGDEDGVEDDDSDAESVGHISDIPDSPASATETVRAVPTSLNLPEPSLGGVPDPASVADTPTLASAARLEVPVSNAAHKSDSERADDSEPSSRRMRHREIVIPLTADTEFLDTLTGALTNLSNLQAAQRDSFVANTESLASSVARVASPYATKNDLYVWREIFTLYVEMQIFESEREKDRGELSVDESEARLRRFAAELAKRGWTVDSPDASISEADGEKKKGKGKGLAARLRQDKSGVSSLPLKDRRSVAALEDFLRLNLALLDVKKFQRINVEAARKILKKHDKRTALTASSDLRAFMAQQERVRMNAASGLTGAVEVSMDAFGSGALVASGASTHPSLAALLPTSATGLLSESLPHILLSLLTTTLLPILPSIDDYSCAICTGVAWRPIRLDCSHLFCIRCLVKLQKKGKIDCPLCRQKGVVGSADGRNVDEAMTNFMKTWFPREVDEKNKENESDRRREELAELGLRVSADQEKCVIA